VKDRCPSQTGMMEAWPPARRAYASERMVDIEDEKMTAMCQEFFQAHYSATSVLHYPIGEAKRS
jgi:hypothetical protein